MLTHKLVTGKTYPGAELTAVGVVVLMFISRYVMRSGSTSTQSTTAHALGPIGHEFIGVVEDVGAEVHEICTGDLFAPFTFCDGTCANCLAGWPSNCLNGGSFGNHGVDGGQVRVQPGAQVRAHRRPDLAHHRRRRARILPAHSSRSDS